VNKCKIIAELGCNWIGDLNLAESMIKSAAECGADYIKTQTWQEKKLKKGPWDSDKILYKGMTERDIYKISQLDTVEKHQYFLDLCKKYKIKYLTTLFCPKDYYILPKMDEIKIAGIEADNIDLLKLCAEKFKHIFISICGLKEDSIRKTADFLHHKNVDFTLMWGVYRYPCSLECSNMFNFKQMLNFHKKIGYSDHTEGVVASLYAIANEAAVVERHFTTDRSLPLDNGLSCIPDELKILCDFRNGVEKILLRNKPDESFILDSFKGRWSEN